MHDVMYSIIFSGYTWNICIAFHFLRTGVVQTHIQAEHTYMQVQHFQITTRFGRTLIELERVCDLLGTKLHFYLWI